MLEGNHQNIDDINGDNYGQNSDMEGQIDLVGRVEEFPLKVISF